MRGSAQGPHRRLSPRVDPRSKPVSAPLPLPASRSRHARAPVMTASAPSARAASVSRRSAPAAALGGRRSRHRFPWTAPEGTTPARSRRPPRGNNRRNETMSKFLNRVQLIGNLGRIRKSAPRRQAASSAQLATGETWNDRHRRAQERTEWHRVVVFLRYREFATPGARDVGHPTAGRRRSAGERCRGHGAPRLGFPVTAERSRSARNSVYRPSRSAWPEPEHPVRLRAGAREF